MNKELLKKVGIYAGIILLFAVLAYSFTPQVLSGKIVNQSDISAWKGMAQEAVAHNAAHPEDQTAWTNSMFGGMPTTAIIDDFDGDWTQKIYKFLLTGRRPASYLLLALIGGFLLMLSMGTSKLIAIAGAIAIAFCSYNFQIIQVGHNTKMQAIAYFPWVLAGIIFTYRAALGHGFFDSIKKDSKSASGKENDTEGWKSWLPKTILGATLFALALSMQIKANHIQITYYLAIVIIVYAIALLISLCIDKTRRALLKRFFIASALLLVIGGVGIATNANKLIPTYKYTPYTMRGGSELSADSDTHNDRGLDLAYATAWSYGIEEMPNLLIPNYNGGSSSGELPMDSETAKLLKRAGQPNLRETMKSMPLYWGPQPFTAGPMYMGAITVFLFVLGLFLCKGREKWWMLVAAVISIFLAWGNHFMWFTRLWFEYAPLYNKFRTVSMALTTLQVLMPLLGFYALDRIIKEKYTSQEFFKAALPAYIITGLFCLVCWLAPGIAGTFTGSVDAGQHELITEALMADRQTLLANDARRSFFLITILCLLILWAFRKPKYDAVGKNGSFVMKGRMTIVAVSVILLVWLDLFSVGKRFLNKDHFVTQKDFTSIYEPRPVDEVILEDTSLDYRVLDISVNTFNDAIPSYHHKTIGGYSPVKLQRYQDLIEKYLTSEINEIYGVINDSETIQDIEDNLPELTITSLLNGKYIILGGEYPPIFNRFAKGNAWFVDSAVAAANPDEEIALIGAVDLGRTAVIGDDFAWARESVPELTDATTVETSPTRTITLTDYAPNELRYAFSTEVESAAVFSEIYYPEGWKAWIEPAGAYGEVRGGHYRPTAEGRPVELFRADWILRGAIIPEGEGQIIMRFEPESYAVGKNISTASSILLILLLLGSVAGMVITTRRKDDSKLIA